MAAPAQRDQRSDERGGDGGGGPVVGGVAALAVVLTVLVAVALMASSSAPRVPTGKPGGRATTTASSLAAAPAATPPDDALAPAAVSGRSVLRGRCGSGLVDPDGVVVFTCEAPLDGQPVLLVPDDLLQRAVLGGAGAEENPRCVELGEPFGPGRFTDAACDGSGLVLEGADGPTAVAYRLEGSTEVVGRVVVVPF